MPWRLREDDNMYGNMGTVTLGGKKYPVKCDINVLIEIQEQFDGLNNFEMLLTGFRLVKDPDGSAAMDGDGKPLFEVKEPSLRAIRVVLPHMLREAAAALKDTDPVDLSEAYGAIEAVQFDLIDTANTLHNEFSRCFERKNVPSAGNREGKKG